MWIVKINSKGAITLPIEAIEAVGWREGDTIRQMVKDGSVWLRKVHWVCQECGSESSGGRQVEVSCWHEDTCDICDEIKPVTETRDFFYPDFTAVKKKKKNG